MIPVWLFRIWQVGKSGLTALGGIGAWIAAFFGMSLTQETTEIAAKAARVAIFVSVMAAAATALIYGFSSAISAAQVTLPASVLASASKILPTNLLPCIIIVISARIAKYAYDWTYDIASKLSE
jgi:hypothetical protein